MLMPLPFHLSLHLHGWRILKAGQGAGREQRAFFGRNSHSGPAHFPAGMEEVSGSIPGMGLVELLLGVSVVYMCFSYWPQSRVANTLRSSLLCYSSCEMFQHVADHRRRCQHIPNLIYASHWGFGYKT